MGEQPNGKFIMEEKKKKLTFVLPLAIKSKENIKMLFSDLDRVQIFLLHSFRKFVDKELVDKIIIITPPLDFEKVNASLRSFTSYLPLEIISDSDICPELNKYKNGWVKQQIIKLKIAEIIKTEYYFTLDSDMFFSRKCNYNDFFVNNKPRINLHLFNEHIIWWKNTANFLKYDFSTYKTGEFGPSFTPVIMNTNLVKETIKKIQSLSGNISWIDFMMNSIEENNNVAWTEYCLYYLYLHFEKGGVEKYYHYDDDNSFNFYVGPSIWRTEDFEKITAEHVKEMFRPDSFHFIIVIQSTLEIPVDRVIEKLNLFFKL